MKGEYGERFKPKRYTLWNAMAVMLWCCACWFRGRVGSRLRAMPAVLPLIKWRKDTKRKRKWEAISCLNKSQQISTIIRSFPSFTSFLRAFYMFFTSFTGCKSDPKLIQTDPKPAYEWSFSILLPWPAAQETGISYPQGLQTVCIQKQVSSIPFYRQLISFTQIRNVNNVNMIYKYLNNI